MGSGKSPSNSGQAQILAYEGTLFVINGANDVFAFDVDTGAILWIYHGNPDTRSGVPMGKSSRGVAMHVARCAGRRRAPSPLAVEER
jgi:glucose dehydrogenase